MKNGFKETEIGDIPVDWEVVRLGDVITEIISGDWGQAKVENVSAFAKCKVIRGTDFANVQRLSFHAVPERFVKRNSIEKRQIKPGDLLIEISGGSKNQPTGRTLFVSSEMLQKVEYPILFTNFVKLLRLDSEVCDASYFYRFWIYLYDLGRTSIYEKRTTGIRNFKYKDFIANEKLLLPSIPEQQKIARVLSTIQQAIEQQDKILASVRELKKTLMRKLFTEGLGDAELKETEIGMVPEDWEIKPLIDIATLQRGKDLPKRNQIPGPYPIIGSSGILGSHNKYVCTGPGVVTGRSGTIGKLTYIDEDYWPHNTGLYVKNFHGNNPKFVYYLLHLLDFEKYATGVSVPTLNRNFIHSALLQLPPLQIQHEIARILSIVDKKIEVEENRKGLLQELFKTMLHKLMTGQLRVKDLEV